MSPQSRNACCCDTSEQLPCLQTGGPSLWIIIAVIILILLACILYYVVRYDLKLILVY